MTGATLFRRNGPAWRFVWQRATGMYMHYTVKGNVYGILGVGEGKPIFIGRKSGVIWYTAEADIGAEYIQFDNGAEYWFRGKPK